MTKEQKIIRAKVGLLELARQLGNVSQACKMMGYSRDSFYRFKELYDAGGQLALQELTRRKPILKNRTPPDVEAIIVALSHEAYHLRTVRQLLERKAEQQTPLPFLEEHPLIRPLDDYAQVVAAAWARQTSSMAQPAESAAAPQRFLRHGWTKESAGEGEEAMEVMTCPSAATPQDSAQQNGPTGDIDRQQGPADFLPPRSGYPSSGCSPAEPDSVSPDSTRVIPAVPPSTTFSGEAS
jgi:hypothetical protein